MTGRQILLIGMPGSGKTTIGRGLAKSLGISFCDLDEELVNQEGISIREIFARQGEEAFRELETTILMTALKGDPSVIATGGGVIMRQSNRLAMKEGHKEGHLVIYLEASVELLYARLEGEIDRPLLLGEDKKGQIESLLAQRAAIYLKTADLILKVDGLSEKEAVDRLCQMVKH